MSWCWGFAPLLLGPPLKLLGPPLWCFVCWRWPSLAVFLSSSSFCFGDIRPYRCLLTHFNSDWWSALGRMKQVQACHRQARSHTIALISVFRLLFWYVRRFSVQRNLSEFFLWSVRLIFITGHWHSVSDDISLIFVRTRLPDYTVDEYGNVNAILPNFDVLRR